MVGDIFLNSLCPPPTFSNVCCRLWLCFMYLCKNGNTPSIFKHIYTLKPINKCTARSKNILFKSLCKKPFAKFKLSYRGSLLWNEFFAPNNDLLEAVTMGYLYFPAPDPGPGPQFVFNGPGTKFVFTGPGTKFVFTASTRPEFAHTDLVSPIYIYWSWSMMCRHTGC